MRSILTLTETILENSTDPLQGLIATIVLEVVGLIVGLVFLFVYLKKSKMRKGSAYIAQLDRINRKYTIKNYSKTVKYEYHCHDLRNYRKFNAAAYLLNILLSEPEDFMALLTDMDNNEKNYQKYLEEYYNVKSYSDEDTAKKLKMSLEKVQEYEKKYCRSNKKNPPVVNIKYVIYCYINNTQREGKYKTVITFDQAKTLFLHFYEQKIESDLLDVTRDIRTEMAKKERSLLTDSLRYDILKRDGFRCKICGATAEDGVKLHVDHIIPVSKGGKTVPSNLRTLCERCNLGKNDKIE